MIFKRLGDRGPPDAQQVRARPLERPMIFISHSHLDHDLADLLKSELEEQWGFPAFVAHVDISPSLQWRDEIRNELAECDVFLAILSANWEASSWTDQEAGIAVASGKVIIPISIDGTMPYGFIETYQALKWDSKHTRENLRSLVRTILERVAVDPEKLVLAFERSPTLDDVRFRLRPLLPMSSLSPEQSRRIARAALFNSHIREAKTGREDIKAFVSKNWEAFDTPLQDDLSEAFGLGATRRSARVRPRLPRGMLSRKSKLEDLFLITSQGRLIMHTTRRLRADRDSDILSGMLTAIMLFVRDSFREENADLKRFEFGDRKVAVERLEHVIGAAILVGSASRNISSDLQNFLWDVQDRFGDKLVHWSGEVEDIVGLRDMMEEFGRHGKWRRGDWHQLYA